MYSGYLADQIETRKADTFSFSRWKDVAAIGFHPVERKTRSFKGGTLLSG